MWKQDPEANIFGTRRDDNGEWRRLQNEELHSLYRSPNIVRVIKSKRLRWTSHVARMEKCRSAFKILIRKPTGKKRFGPVMVTSVAMNVTKYNLWLYWRGFFEHRMHFRVHRSENVTSLCAAISVSTRGKKIIFYFKNFLPRTRRDGEENFNP